VRPGPEEGAADIRLAQLHAWLESVLGTEAGCLQPISSDASFRRYYRLRHGDGTLVAMDSPPDREPPAPFVHVAALLRGAGVNAPRILAADLERGFLLLPDLGRRSYLEVLDAGNADELFRDALAALVRWQLATRPRELPPYDCTRLRGELDLFAEWYVGVHLGLRLYGKRREVWHEACGLLLDNALGQPRVYVHRDYMPRNLLVSEPNPGVIDFQDAVEGPVTYDAVCLFRDAFLSWEEGRVQDWALQYHERAKRAGLPVPADRAEFLRAFDWMGMQRHLKVLGIFARLCHRDGKPAYLADAPRFLGYLRAAGRRYTGFTGLLHLLDELEAGTGGGPA